jgi:glycosyltransferase involved in cell wall biosynthesis
VDRAATVALVAGRLLNVPYSVTAHANDIYVNPVLLPEKLSEAKFVATCTGYNRQYLSGIVPLNGKLHCFYHGLDLEKYRSGKPSQLDMPLITAVGQLKEKKGFHYLLKACQTLKLRGYAFHCQIIGEGPMRASLERQIRELSLEAYVALRGALPHQEVIHEYQRSMIFALPCITASDGDRDGIPNVLLEAMAMQLPVVSTQHSGIPEVVRDEVSGLLVPPADEQALAEALARLLDEPVLRSQMGSQGRQTVTENFNSMRNAKRLLDEMVKV